jgi:predicted MFS family arabinose efflux permease
MPIGAAAGGLLAQALGLRAVFALMGALTLALCLGMLIVTDARMNAAEGAADQVS